MSQNDHSIANADGATVRADLNNALQALASNNSGAAAPATTYANMWWMDETNDLLKQRAEANTAWITVASKVGSVWLPYRDGTALGTAAVKDTGADAGEVPTNDQAFTDVASAATTDIGAASSENVRITGTTTITGLGTVGSGLRRRVRFAAALTLTHNATSLILPGSANITTAANDTAEFISLGSGNWLCLWYKPAGSAPGGGGAVSLYDFIDTSDVSINTIVPTGKLWSSSQGIDIPTKGLIRYTPYVRIDNSSGATRNYAVGLRINGTDYWQSVDDNGSIVYQDVAIPNSEYKVFKGGMLGSGDGTKHNLDIEGYGISTGVQTVQPIISSDSTSSTQTLKGTTVTARLHVEIMDRS